MLSSQITSEKYRPWFMLFTWLTFLQLGVYVNGKVLVVKAHGRAVGGPKKETATILVSQAIPSEIKLYFYAKILFCSGKPIWSLVTWVKTLYKPSPACNSTF